MHGNQNERAGENKIERVFVCLCVSGREREGEGDRRESEREGGAKEAGMESAEQERQNKENRCVYVCSKSSNLSQTAPNLVVLFRKCTHHCLLVWVGNYCKTP